MNYNQTISVGDWVMRPKFFGLLEHIGVFLGNNMVYHNTPERGEHVSTLREFSAGQPVKVQRTGAEPSSVIARAKKALANPKEYDAARRNCQHTASEIVYGVAKSPFVVTCVILLAVILLVMFLTRRR